MEVHVQEYIRHLHVLNQQKDIEIKMKHDQINQLLIEIKRGRWWPSASHNWKKSCAKSVPKTWWDASCHRQFRDGGTIMVSGHGLLWPHHWPTTLWHIVLSIYLCISTCECNLKLSILYFYINVLGVYYFSLQCGIIRSCNMCIFCHLICTNPCNISCCWTLKLLCKQWVRPFIT